MTYFDRFPLIRYDILKNGSEKLATDILRRITFRDRIIEEGSLFNDYAVQDGETPEMVAEKFYGSPTFHWIVLLFNEILDPYLEWPMSDNQLLDYLDKKYPGRALFLLDETGTFLENELVLFSDFKGRVDSWEPSLKKLVIYNETGAPQAGDTITSYDSAGNTITATIGRVVDIHRFALDHFETNDETKDLNPLGTSPDSNGRQLVIGQTGDAPYTVDAVTFGNTILYSYITGNTPTTHRTITIAEEQEKNNDSRRTIRLLKEDYVERVNDEFTRIMRDIR